MSARAALNNLQQQIWDERGGTKTRYLLVSGVRNGQWEVTLWSNSGEAGKSRVWAGVGNDTRAREIADAIVAGMMHIEERPRGGGLKLYIHVPKPVITVYLDVDDAGVHLPGLVDASFEALSKSETSGQVRALTAQLEAKDAEIAALNAKYLNLRARVSRQTATGPKRDGTLSPQKPRPPVAMNRLQLNQKRRKLVEEEFAGSDESEDDDDDDDDDG